MQRLAILPTLHSLHLEPSYSHYSLDRLAEVLASFAPGLLLAEIRPIDYAAGRMGSLEYQQVIIPYCRRHGVPVEPYDYYDPGDLATFARLSDLTPEQEAPIRAVTAEIAFLCARRELGLGAFLDPLVLDLLRRKHALQEKIFPAEEQKTWHERNQQCLANILAALDRHPGQRALLCTGLERLAWFSDQLAGHVALLPLVS